MKTAAKVWLSIGGGLLAIGLVIGLIGGGIYRFSPNSKGKYTEQNKSFSANGISTIQIDSIDDSIQVIPVNGDSINITYYTSEEEQITCIQNGSAIELLQERKNWISVFSDWHFFSFDIDMNAHKIVVEVPMQYAGNFDLQTTNSSIKANGFNELSELKMKSTNGSLHADDMSAQSVSLKTTNSKITLENIESDTDIVAKTSNGSITVKNSTAESTIDLSNTNGSLTIDESTAKTINGSSTNSSISIDEIAADKIDLVSTNGKISGSILGIQAEYNIKTSTTNGNTSPSTTTNSDNQKSLEARTTNANIDIRFK